MRANDVAVQYRNVPPVLHDEDGEGICCGGLAGAAESGQPDASALAMAWGVAFREDIRNLWAGEPLRQLSAFVEIILPHLRPRQRHGGSAPRHFGRLLVAILFRQIDQLHERNDVDSDLGAVRLDQLLRVVWAVEGTAGRVVAWACVVSSHDQVVCPVVAADYRVPECLAGPAHPHCQR